MSPESAFKTCPCCSYIWPTREAFMSDPSLELNGYQVDFKNLERGMFYFTHNTEPCRSTMVIMMSEFRDLYSGETYQENKALSDECPRYCINEKQLARCDVLCECAFVREVIQIILESQSQAEKTIAANTPKIPPS